MRMIRHKAQSNVNVDMSLNGQNGNIDVPIS